MSKQDFDSYRFSNKTQVYYFSEWKSITEVDFRERWVGIESGQILRHHEITDIRENE